MAEFEAERNLGEDMTPKPKNDNSKLTWLIENIHYENKEIHTWDDLIGIYGQKFSNPSEPWIFRGQSNVSWGLQTTLEREIARLRLEKNNTSYNRGEALRTELRNGIPLNNEEKKKKSIFEIEAGLLREFKRKCHHYVIDIPEKDDIAEWLALMRHYRAPSRFLDWNYSFFIALFFAVEEAEDCCAVWALEQN